MYAPLTSADAAGYAAAARVKRLNKTQNNWILGMFFDLLFGAGPWVFGVAIVASGLAAIYAEVDGAKDTFQLFNAPVAITAISTFASFLLVGKQSTNLGNNADHWRVWQSERFTGQRLPLPQVSDLKRQERRVPHTSDGTGGFFQTTRIGLVCASVMHVVNTADAAPD